MNAVLALLAPVALIGPVMAGPANGPWPELRPEPNQRAVADADGLLDNTVWEDIAESFRPEPQAQVRIEQRVIIRVAPRAPPPYPDRMIDAPQPGGRRVFEEEGMGRCVPIRKIESVRVGEHSRLLLFMRNHRLISAKLEKSCNIRDFYSGFYVEDTGDGKLCAGRDVLHSRAGGNCELARLYRLNPAEDDD